MKEKTTTDNQGWIDRRNERQKELKEERYKEDRKKKKKKLTNKT